MTTILRRRSALAAAATALALGGGLLLPPAAAGAAGPSPATPHRADGTAYDITLITGDVVHYTDRPGSEHDLVAVDRPDGAPGSVHIQETGGQLYVVPDEAQSLLAAGRLDRRLFSVTELVKSGYDDRRSGGIPVIATGAGGARRPAAPAAPKGATHVRPLDSIGATAMKADKDTARAFWKDLAPAAEARSLDGGVGKLWLDGRVRAELAESVPQIGAPQAWARGLDGAGVKVAVLDTGIDPAHPDLADRVAASRSFVDGQEVLDRQGHGTHVASTIAGSGAASDGTYKGVAPGARLYVGKVLDNDGFGSDSQIIAGMEWAKEQGADVVSMSLGSDEPSDGTDPMAMAVDTLSANGGPLFVIAAGNRWGEFTIGSPGAADAALTVAAVDKSDVRADFSSMGPLTGTYGLKPDVSAPGVDIRAAASQAAPNVTGMYETMSGTSMATPHVAGAAAILKQAHPGWDGQRVKDALMATAKGLDGYTPYQQGTGRIDIPAALDAAVEAPGSVPTAVFDWPHETGETAERTVTYRNTSGADVSLDLAVDPPSDAYRLSADTLTVPAGGTASVTLTIDPASLAADSYASARITASAGGAVVARTAFAVQKERELYDLTLKLTDRDGSAGEGRVVLVREGDFWPSLYEVNGSRTLRAAPGNYTAYWWPDMPGSTPDSLAAGLVVDPETVVDGPTAIHLDGTRLRLVSARTDRPTADSQRRVDFSRAYPDGSGIREMWPVPVAYDEVWATPTERPATGSFDYLTRWRLHEKQLTVTTADGRDLGVLPQPGGTIGAAGTRTLDAVYAGAGGAADYADLDVRGKAAVVVRSDAVSAQERAVAAVEAGAAALLVVHDGTGRLNEVYSDGDFDRPLVIASVKRDAGARLLEEVKAGGLRLTVREKRWSSYLYDLVDLHTGRIPDRDLTYAPDPRRDLARVENTFHTDGTARLGSGYRYDIPAWGTAQFIGFPEYESFPGRRTEWVTPKRTSGQGYWYEEHAVTGAAGDALLEERDDARHYTPGGLFAQEWFAPVQHPRFGTGYWGPFRQDNDYIQTNVPMWSDSGDGHAGTYPAGLFDGSIRSQLFQGDRLLASADSPALYTEEPVSRDPLPYRLVVRGDRDKSVWATSTKVRSEWGFVSAGLDESADIRLLDLDFDVRTDLAGRVPSGTVVELGLGAATQSWLPDRVRASQATLSVSYDGGDRWQRVTLTRTGEGRWVAYLKTPPRPGEFVSLRATAQGPGGLSVSQEIIRAFGLK
ncbi:S8 family serine peptidase [Streptomyces sp. NPDC051940]|uniref:S8 family serine peptidase n=1 Tax=Streptomyces sp. NPDC051940 TaxID=3155675 RepID=UPI003426A0CB